MASLLPGQSTEIVLTPRQAEMCELVARGLSNKRIAAATDLSIKTVESYLTALSARLPGDGGPRQKIIRLYFSILQV